MKANEICNSHGLDTISTGGVVSFAMECFEKGLLTTGDTAGLKLQFGNADAMVALVENIALRKGLGDLLAEGTQRAAEKIGRGAAEFAMHVKGEEIPMHEPRYKPTMALHYSVHATGATVPGSMRPPLWTKTRRADCISLGFSRNCPTI